MDRGKSHDAPASAPPARRVGARLKLLSGSNVEIAKYLDAIEVTSPREREMMHVPVLVGIALAT